MSDQRFCRHGGRLRYAHELEDGRCNIAQGTVLDFLHRITGTYYYELHLVKRVGCIGSSVSIDSIVGIAVIGCEQHDITVCESCGYNCLHASVYAPYCIANSLVDSGMADHVTIREIEDDHIFFLGTDCRAELVGNLDCAHLGLQVVGCHLRRIDKNAVLMLERSLAPAIEKEGDVGVFLCLGDTQLISASPGNSFSESILDFFLVKEDMESGEGGIVGSKAAVIQRNGVHTLIRHSILCQHIGKLAGTVVAEIEEYHRIPLFYLCERPAVLDNDNRLDEFVCDVRIIRRLDPLGGGGEFRALALDEHIIRFFDTRPAFVSVHCIETAADCSNLACGRCHLLLELLHESKSAVRVGIASVHETMYIDIVQAGIFGVCKKFIKMIET